MFNKCQYRLIIGYECSVFGTSLNYNVHIVSINSKSRLEFNDQRIINMHWQHQLNEYRYNVRVVNSRQNHILNTSISLITSQ